MNYCSVQILQYSAKLDTCLQLTVHTYHLLPTLLTNEGMDNQNNDVEEEGDDDKEKGSQTKRQKDKKLK